MERLINAPSGKNITDKIQELITDVNDKEERLARVEEATSQTHIAIKRYGSNGDEQA